MINEKKYRLGIFEEAVGTLTELVEDEGILIARISEVILALPHEVADRLRPLIGQRIGVLRTDIPKKEYLVRTCSKEKIRTFGEIVPEGVCA
jgi:hypothetical protein